MAANGALAVRADDAPVLRMQTLVENNGEVNISIADDDQLYIATRGFLDYNADPRQPGRLVISSLDLTVLLVPLARLPVETDLGKFHPLVIRGVDAALLNRISNILKNKGFLNEDFTGEPAFANALARLDVADAKESLVIQPSDIFEGDPFDDPGEPARQPRGRAQQAPPPGREPAPGPANIRYLAEVNPAALQDAQSRLPLKPLCRLLKLIGKQGYTHAARRDPSGAVQKAARLIKIFASQHAYADAAAKDLDDAAISLAVGPFLKQVELPPELLGPKISSEEAVEELSDAHKFARGSSQDVDQVINRRLIHLTKCAPAPRHPYRNVTNCN